MREISPSPLWRKAFCVRLIVSLLTATAPSPAVGQVGSNVGGTVLDGQCTAVGNARIIASTLTGKVLAETVTNENGQYALLNLPAGQVRLAVEPRGNGLQRGSVVTNVAPEGLDVNWVSSRFSDAVPVVGNLIQPAGRFDQGASAVAGRVLIRDGKPLTGVEVALKSSDGKVLNKALTDAQGQYRLAAQKPGVYQLTLNTSSHGFSPGSALVCAYSGTPAINWVVSAEAGAVASQDAIYADGGLVGLGVFSSGLVVLGTVGAITALRVASPSQ